VCATCHPAWETCDSGGAAIVRGEWNKPLLDLPIGEAFGG
jgi:hypothetical protein